MRTRTFLFVALALVAILTVGCSSSEKTAITLADFENIGFTKEEEVAYDYQGLSESWDGAITVNGTSQFLEVVIFDNAPDEFNKDQFETLGLGLHRHPPILFGIQMELHLYLASQPVFE